MEERVPKIRVEGFEEPWEQRKLGETASYRRGSFPQPYGRKDWYDGANAMPFVQVADVSDEMRLVEDTKQKISMLAQPLSVFAEKNSVIVTLQGSIGRVAIMQYGAFIDRTILIFEKYNIDIDNSFWAYIIRQKFIEEAQKAPGGTIKTITKEALSDFDLFIPSFNEQKRVGLHLLSLDALITLSQQKLDKLKTFKKSCLEKMFPKDGETVPEVRFQGFEGPWEKKRLGDISSKVTEKNSQGIYTETFTNSAELGIISQRDYFDHDISNEANVNGYYIVRKEDFIYNPRISSSAPCGPINCNFLGRNGIISPLYTVFRTKNVNRQYLSWFFKSNFWHAFMKFNGDSGARSDRFSIKDDLFFQMPIPVPDEKEQQKIGVFLSDLNHLVVLQQQRLDKLKNLKKALLDKMFV